VGGGRRVNAVDPGYIEPPLTRPVPSNPTFLASYLALTPMVRVGQSQDVVGLAKFLCLPAATYITGQCIEVDGGATPWGAPVDCNGPQAGAHRITWSARLKIDRGTVTPTAFADLRLTTSSNSLACSIGNSWGDAPRRILST
jgi:hypothetical protein